MDEPEGIMLSDVSQAQNKSCMISLHVESKIIKLIEAERVEWGLPEPGRRWK